MLTLKDVKYLNNVNDILLIKQEYEKDNNLDPMDINNDNMRQIISSISLDKNIFVVKDNILPFALYKNYLIVSNTSDIIEQLVDTLNSIKCDLSKLQTLSTMEVFNRNGLDDEKCFFIINSQYRIIEK